MRTPDRDDYPAESAPSIPIDPQLVPILELVQQAIPVVGLVPDTIPQLRAAFAARPTDADLRLGGKFEIDEVVATDLSGDASVPLLICRPSANTIDAPVLLYAHGGGLVAGHNRSNLPDVLELAATVGACVVSIEYRLAPEHPYPAALDDCRTALDWVRREARHQGMDASRIITCGTSAGGGLMAAVGLLGRDSGDPGPLGQMLLSPMLNDAETISARQMTGKGVWDQASNLTAWAAYLPEPVDSQHLAYSKPGSAPDLRGLPSTFLDVGSAETFRDDLVDFARRMWAGGGDTELHVWPGGFHNFDSMVPDALVSHDAKEARRAWLRRILSRCD